MRILITGASGFIGAHLVARLNGEGHEIFVLPSERFRAARLAGHRYTAVETAGEARAEVVYHLAGAPWDAGLSETVQERVIVGGMERLLAGLLARRPRRLVVAGSAAEYGSGSGWCEDDEDTAQPDTVFGRLKRQAGERARASGIASVLLRVFTPFGEGEAPERLVPSALRAALAGEPVRLRSTGAQTRDYFHVADLVDALVEAGRRPLEPGIAINLCSGVERAVADVASHIVELTGSPAPVQTGPEAASVMARSSGNPERAARLLGWRPRIGFEEALRRTMFWMKEQRNL